MLKAFHIKTLTKELSRRKKKMPRYSLRAFARDLEIDPGQLSKILKGSLPLCLKRSYGICEQLDLTQKERTRFLDSAFTYTSPGDESDESETQNEITTLEYDTFQAISDLKYFALLELTYLKDFKSDVAWIAKRLGLPLLDVDDALRRLKRLGLIEINDGKIRKNSKSLETEYRATFSEALQNHHAEALRRARKSLKTNPPDTRNNHSITLAGDPKKLKVARKMTMEFLNDLTRYLETGEQTELYEISFSLFPLTLKET